MKCRVLHLGSLDKFTQPFWCFIEDHLDIENHLFLYKHMTMQPQRASSQWIDGHGWRWFYKFIRYAYPAKKIILHSLFDFRMVVFLALQPWLLKKCYWVVWGGDLYCYLQNRNWKRNIKEKFRKQVIQNVGHLITIPGDYELAQQWYQARGQSHISLFYPNNLYQDYTLKGSQNGLFIQVGNSADPSNEHVEFLRKLSTYQDETFNIVVPLSYGNQEYAQEVIQEGEKLFQERFLSLTEFLPFEEYIAWLSNVDIAVFNHRRQQAMGNIFTLLSLGKKVYLRKDVTTYSFLKDLGLIVFDIDRFDLNMLSQEEKEINQKIIRSYASKENLTQELETFLN